MRGSVGCQLGRTLRFLPRSLKILFSSSTSDSPGKSGFIINSSPKMHPHDQTSIAVEYSLIPSKSSGARYHNVTTIAVYACNGDPYSRARPKSPTCIKCKYKYKIYMCFEDLALL